MSRKLPLKALIIGSIAIVVVCGVLVGLLLLKPTDSSPEASPEEDQQTQEERLPGAKTTEITSERNLAVYKDNLDSNIIRPQYVHDTPVVDWQAQKLIAVQYSLYVARTVQGSHVHYAEDGKNAHITLDALDPPEGCISTQINEVNVSFVAVKKSIENFTISLNRIANPNKCFQ